jgi:hypothetical protein
MKKHTGKLESTVGWLVSELGLPPFWIELEVDLETFSEVMELGGTSGIDAGMPCTEGGAVVTVLVALEMLPILGEDG